MSTTDSTTVAAPSGAALSRSDNLGINLVISAIDRWQHGRGSADDVTAVALMLTSRDHERARQLCAEALTRWRAVGVIDETNPPCNNDTQGDERMTESKLQTMPASSTRLHVVLTPPGEKTTVDNIGIVRVPKHCADVAERYAQQFAALGYTTSIVPDPFTDFPDDHPAVQRGGQYVDDLAARADS